MSTVHNKVTAMRELWDKLSKKSSLNFVSHLKDGAEWDIAEFHLTGMRFTERILERFNEYAPQDFTNCTVAEIGCGVGRFSKNLACRFKHVFAFDVSENMLNDARVYCGCMHNITFAANDGLTLKELEDESIDYCCTAGVFQHITHIDVILSYIREGLRALKPGGLILFQFEANHVDAEGEGGSGARIHAKALDEGLSAVPFSICEVSIDPLDPTRNMVIVLRKEGEGKQAENPSFFDVPLTEKRWISGVYDDIQTKSAMHDNLKRDFAPLTFYDLED